MTTEPVRAGSDWLALREPSDAAARAVELVEELRPGLPVHGAEIHDLGCGTGSMARWLAARLTGPQHWVLYDRDDELLALAAADPPGAAADGATVTVETRRRDITRLNPEEVTGADLVTASALLDMLTADELERLVATCAAAGCPVLITLSVIGRVDLAPADPLDHRVMDAFNAHQRRATSTGRLLGPDAARAAEDCFRRLGHDVVVRPSPWRLGPDRSELATEWFIGWLGAACEQRPELREAAEQYRRRRLSEAAAGSLSVTVHHRDLLARPGTARPRAPLGRKMPS
jgi:SAM-dependent methyltransferase